jgi:hypothetical protein
MRQVLFLGGLCLRLHLGQVCARAEYIAGARQLHHAHLDISGALRERCAQRAERRNVERVAFFRTIERNLRDAAGNRGRDCGEPLVT